jgi:hypothetical protein
MGGTGRAEKQGEQVLLRPEVGAAVTLPVSHVHHLLETGQAQEVEETTPSPVSSEERREAGDCWACRPCRSQSPPLDHPGVFLRRGNFHDSAQCAELASRISGGGTDLWLRLCGLGFPSLLIAAIAHLALRQHQKTCLSRFFAPITQSPRPNERLPCIVSTGRNASSKVSLL